jgi:hypothetical protein
MAMDVIRTMPISCRCRFSDAISQVVDEDEVRKACRNELRQRRGITSSCSFPAA